MNFFDFSPQGRIDRALERQAFHKDFLGIRGFLAFTDSSFGTNDPRTQTKWSDAVFKYGLQNIALMPLMGTSRNSFIHVDSRLLNQPGENVVIESREPFSNPGVGDDGNTTGNEEALKRRNMTITIHERAHSYVSAGKMSEQRTKTNIREDGKEDLGEWLGEVLEDDLATSGAGLYNENSSSSAIQTINESYPTSNRIFYGGQPADGSDVGNSGVTFATDALLTADTSLQQRMGTLLLSLIRRKAIAATPRFRPVIIRDLSKANPDDIRSMQNAPVIGKFFLVLMSPLQIKDVKAETGNLGWAAATQSAQVRGNLNPIFSGAAFLWDGMLVWEYDRIASRTGAGGTTLAEGFLLDSGRTQTDDAVASGRTVHRAMLFGAQGMVLAWGQKPEWSEDFVDNNKPKVKVDMLYGVKRTIFNAHGTSTPTSDEAIYCMDTEVGTE